MTNHRGDHRGFPFSTRPTGWFQLGWSQDFPVGEARPLKYFGRDLVAYRGHSGTVRLFDAFCPHFGAHLGHGGTVVEDDIVCPFHGWRFGCDGRNVEIPYSERRQSANRLTCWEVREDRGIVYFWHDVNGLAPRWGLPEPIGDPADYYPLYPAGVKSWTLRIYPQFVTENAIDFSHFEYVHKAANVPTVDSFGAEGQHVFRARHKVVFGGHAEKTWLTPDGPVVGYLEGELHGVGLGIARFLGVDDAVSLVAVTPVDDEYSIFFMSNWVGRRSSDNGGAVPESVHRRIQEQFKQAERDQPIWEHMIYRSVAPTTPEETPIWRELRAWAKRFYPGEKDYEELAASADEKVG